MRAPRPNEIKKYDKNELDEERETLALEATVERARPCRPDTSRALGRESVSIFYPAIQCAINDVSMFVRRNDQNITKLS